MSLKDHALIDRGINNGFIIVSIIYLYLTFMDHENVIAIFLSFPIVSYYWKIVQSKVTNMFCSPIPRLFQDSKKGLELWMSLADCIQGSKCNPCVAAQSESLRRNFLQHTALMMWC